MKKIFLYLFILLVVYNSFGEPANYSLILDHEVSEKLTEILKLDDENILEEIKNFDFKYKDVKKGKITFSNTITSYDAITDSVELGSILYVPETYDFTKPTPLIVYLHGGISLQEPRNVDEWDITKNDFYPYLEKKGWCGFFPTGKIDFTWWDDFGMNNLFLQINSLRSKYNIDSDRIFLAGVSDGGSGCYSFAALLPNQFASFYPIIGSVGVHSSSRQEAFAPRNLSNRFIYAINNDNDNLYPSKAMSEINKILFANEANILYKEMVGYSHEFPYGSTEIPQIIDLMEKNPRNPYRSKIYWEAYHPKYGRCDWINITGIDSTMKREEWHKKFQHKCWTKRIIFGFVPEEDLENGYKIKSVNEGYIADKIGLKSGDVIEKINDIALQEHDDIWKVKENIIVGKEFTFFIARDGKKMELKGVLDHYLEYEAFPYKSPSGAIVAEYFDNEFRIKTSRISTFQLFLNDIMINKDIPVRVYVNGKLLFDAVTKVDPQFVKRDFQLTLDKKEIWYGKIDFKLKF